MQEQWGKKGEDETHILKHILKRGRQTSTDIILVQEARYRESKSFVVEDYWVTTTEAEKHSKGGLQSGMAAIIHKRIWGKILQ
eukprot:6429091-Prorocentrum_lima.AAC.1